MNIIVQKFGGTSTRSRESRSTMYNNIIREINNGNSCCGCFGDGSL